MRRSPVGRAPIAARGVGTGEQEVRPMLHVTQKALYVAVPVLVGVGIGSAVILGAGPERREATIPAGTTLVAALERTISTADVRVGDPVMLSTVQPVRLP